MDEFDYNGSIWLQWIDLLKVHVFQTSRAAFVVPTSDYKPAFLTKPPNRKLRSSWERGNTSLDYNYYGTRNTLKNLIFWGMFSKCMFHRRTSQLIRGMKELARSNHWRCFENIKFWDTLILYLLIYVMKMNSFRGDLAEVSAKTKVREETHRRNERCWIHR